MKIRFLVCLTAGLLSACSAEGIRQSLNIQGAQQVAVNDEAARSVDLVQLIIDQSPDSPAIVSRDPTKAEDATDAMKSPCINANTQSFEKKQGLFSAMATPFMGDVERKERVNDTRNCLELATKKFYADPTAQQARRNRIQARLIAASNAECADFTQYLNTLQANGNLISGLLATGFSAAGAVVTDSNSARILAGLAAAATGSRAEFNADLFFRQSVPVLTKAIRTSRQDFLRDTIVASRGLSIEQYTLWDSIGDAFRYNDMCSLVSGLSTLDTAVTLAESPGIDAVNRTLIKVNLAHKIANENITDLSSIPAATADFAALNQNGSLTAGPGLLSANSSGFDVQAEVVRSLKGQYLATENSFQAAPPKLRNSATVSTSATQADTDLKKFFGDATTALTGCAPGLAKLDADVELAGIQLGTTTDANRAQLQAGYSDAVQLRQRGARDMRAYSDWLSDALAQARRLAPGGEATEEAQVKSAFDAIHSWFQQVAPNNSKLKPSYCPAAPAPAAAAPAAASPADADPAAESPAAADPGAGG